VGGKFGIKNIGKLLVGPMQPERGTEYVANHGIAGAGDHQAARDLLLTLAPRLNGQALQQPGEPTVSAAMRVALSLDRSIFPIQGPPGAGKTYTALE
jgi:hypothetical protein